jgi:protein-L-isoaspartate O-methyltransferase
MTLHGADHLHPKDKKNRDAAAELGAAARRALTSLSAAIYGPATCQWLEKHLLLTEGGKGLHPGCGGGEDTLLIASLLGGQALLHGIDEDPALIEAARQKTALSGLEQVHFVQAGLSDWKTDVPYDFIFARIQPATAQYPDQWPADLHRKLKTGGRLLIEITKPSGFQAYPYNHAFARAMELISRLEDDQPYDWPDLLGKIGFTDIETAYAPPAFIPRPYNRIASLSLECYQAEILRRGDSNRAELNALLQDLRVFEQQADALISRPGMLQVWAKND